MKDESKAKIMSILNTDIKRSKIPIPEIPPGAEVTLPGKPQAHCPACGSDHVGRFSRTWKVTKIMSVGPLGLGNVHKIFKCKNCGYKW